MANNKYLDQGGGIPLEQDKIFHQHKDSRIRDGCDAGQQTGVHQLHKQ